MSIPEVIQAAVVGPDQALVLQVRGGLTDELLEALSEWIKAAGLDSRVLVIHDAIEMVVVDK